MTTLGVISRQLSIPIFSRYKKKFFPAALHMVIVFSVIPSFFRASINPERIKALHSGSASNASGKFFFRRFVVIHPLRNSVNILTV